MTQIEELLNIDTPENVQFDYEIAGIGSRFMAAFVDTILLSFLLLCALFIAGSFVGNLFDAFTDEGNRVTIAIFLLVTFAIFWGYYIISEGLMNGQTVGKRAVGIRVIRSNGLPVSIS
ncbi:MAG: RDD family protein, partial [Chloroflexota bacterium]